MAKSPSSAAQQAREALAARLKEIMRRAGLDGSKVALAAGWHASKSSRILTATTLPSVRDIETWCRVCRVPELADELTAQMFAVDEMYQEWRRLTRGGFAALQDSYVELYRRTRTFKVYGGDIMPGLLQTHGYAQAVLRLGAEFLGMPDDSAQAATARMERNRIVHEGRQTFAFVVEEAVLRQRVGGPETMAAQLAYLLAAMTRPNISLGVIPFAADRTILMKPTFHLLDNRRASVELLSARVVTTAPAEVSEYVRAFAQFADLAVYGDPARSLIRRAITALDSMLPSSE